jgi:hypothetical protein
MGIAPAEILMMDHQYIIGIGVGKEQTLTAGRMTNLSAA